MVLDQLRGTRGKCVHLRPADNKSEVLEKPTDLVLDVSFDLNEQSSTNEKGLDGVAVGSFDAYLLVPPTLHDARDAYCVVAVALVDLHLQRRLRMPGIDADNRKPSSAQFSPQPC